LACHFSDDAWARQPVAAFFAHILVTIRDNGLHSDLREFNRLHLQSLNSGLLPVFLATVFVVAACGEKPAADTASEPAQASFLPAPLPAAAGCGDRGRLQTSLFGALAGDLEWTADTMSCEGMPRPDGRGARLRFSGWTGDSEITIAIIIAVPDLERAKTATELPSNVTVIQEGSGRFFSTSDLHSCWTDINDQRAIDDNAERFSIDGRLYCISPLAEVNGEASVLISELAFSGLVDW